MALDPSIIRGIGVQSNAPLLQSFQNALTQSQQRRVSQQSLGQAQEQAPFQNQLLQLRAELAQEQQPAALQKAQEAASPIAQLNRRDKARLISTVQGAQIISPLLEAGDIKGVKRALNERKKRLASLRIDTTETDEALALANNDPELLKRRVDEALDIGERAGIIKPLARTQTSVTQRAFDRNVESVKVDPELKTVEGRAASIALGLTPKAATTKDERLALDSELSRLVDENRRLQAKSTETGKLQAQKKFKPQIAKAVKLATKEATERGEVLTDLARMEASLPGIKEAVDQLIELSFVATSTLGGKAFDFLVKESGFGSTKGADARAKLIAIVDNQVLPLLKETFGAAFTVQEGANLKASLVDPNASPSQKREQLDAFLTQKERNIRTKQAQLGQPLAQPTQPTGFQSSALGREVSEQDITDTLNANPGLTREQLFQQLGIQ